MSTYQAKHPEQESERTALFVGKKKCGKKRFYHAIARAAKVITTLMVNP